MKRGFTIEIVVSLNLILPNDPNPIIATSASAIAWNIRCVDFPTTVAVAQRVV
jgi:hypothetical protein